MGRLPSLVNLYVAQNSDGSGWSLPAMGGFRLIYTWGTGIYNLTEEWATITAGSGALAYFADASGGTQASFNGYVRFMAWK